ncbi:hypothetical protein CGLO_10935 [Colletotrichum gloeosporioides Cg-14]|uniref:Uncharacterized protein n=1 Tax=Colletotrichum gloeosporioides (strain Cg-14) TaxID=1237896 RepID=T0K236_COLGC|nr:hypothetical protein CGLO_10935 [Colletotrichum gloeosporioides Cg-14]
MSTFVTCRIQQRF